MRAKIYINETLIDVNDDLNLSFTYNISDIREPESRQANYSKTITIPASKTNNKLFSQLFEIGRVIGSTGLNFTPDFNPNKKANARVTIDDLEVMNGFCQVLKVNKQNYEPTSYDIVVISNVKNIFEDIGEDELTSLDLSEFDQLYTTSNVNAYSYGNPSPSYTLGSGVIYNSTYNGVEPIGTYKVAPYPAIFVKTLVDKIFAKYGYQYSSNFFNTNYFKKLCIPFTKSKYTLNNAEVVERTFKLYYGTINYGGFFDVPFRTGEAFFTKNPGINKNNSANLSWGELLDQSNLYDRTIDAYSVKIKKGTNHTVYFSATINSITFDCPQAITNGDLVFTLNFKLYRNRASVLTLLATSSHPYYVGATTPNPSTPDKIIMGPQSFDIAVNETAYPNDEYIMVLNYTTTGELYTSTIVPMQVSIYSNDTNSYDFYNVVSNSGIVLNTSQTLEVNKLIPDKIKIKDFLSSLIKCFNLQLEQDKQFAKKLNIEPYNDYFGSGTEKDWTSKLDIASIDIIPMANLTTNVFKFGFQNDDDLINKDYSEKYPEVYGDYEVAIDNDFVNGTKEIKPIFAASPATRRNVTSFIGEVTYLAKDEDIPRDAKIRMVWYNGLETDNITSPTVAIRFDLAPSELYYSTSTLTNATLYGKFWAKYIDEITDKDSKMVICNMALTALDIANFKFTDNIFVDGHFFRVNKIIDFNPLSDGLTKVELLKIKSFAPLQEDVVTVYESFRSFGIIDGSKDEVRSLGATSFYNIIEGSFNNVRSITATSTIGKIDGGENII
jgi:hypothetical protein